MTPTPNTPEQHRLCPCKGCYVGTECQLKPHILRPNFREIAEDIFNRVTGPDMQRAEDTFKAGLVSRTPNEVDELERQIDRIVNTFSLTTDLKLWQRERIAQAKADLETLITKQQALYHAAGLRELREDWIRCGGKCLCCDLADQAIAREESKASE